MVQEEITKLLSEMVEIKSISSDKNHRDDVDASAQFVENLFVNLGLNTQVIKVAGGMPAVVAHTEIDPSKKTVLLYAHHDVQPVGDLDLWNTDPFDPVIKDGRLYGRGSGDNKAGVVVHYNVVKQLLKDLPVNIRIFIEGEEEIGSPTMSDFIEQNREALEADVIVIADSSNVKIGVPTVTTTLRGLADAIVEVDQPMRPVHSGMGGGIVPDAFMVLSKIIASFHNENGDLMIEGLTPTDMKVAELDKTYTKKMLGSDEINLFDTESISKRLWLEPALSVLAIDAPSVEDAVNLVIPKAKAKISLRLPPTEDPEHAMKMLEQHVMKNIPWNASVKFIPNSKGSGVVADPDKPFTKELVNSFNLIWENETAYIGVGGSIPFANDFVREFPNAELVLVGASDEELGNAHAPNESVQIDHIEMLIESLVKTIKNIS
jgi:acetylornithine deacetylase/succinyl-diaminopimelate desuccinylase-like protein|tara:strand:+ start:1021 stop:2319 length:1299 start_codon:yes stop_codon:yes gene_type:complete